MRNYVLAGLLALPLWGMKNEKCRMQAAENNNTV